MFFELMNSFHNSIFLYDVLECLEDRGYILYLCTHSIQYHINQRPRLQLYC